MLNPTGFPKWLPATLQPERPYLNVTRFVRLALKSIDAKVRPLAVKFTEPGPAWNVIFPFGLAATAGIASSTLGGIVNVPAAPGARQKNDAPVVWFASVVGGLTDDQGAFDHLAGIVPSNTPTGTGTLTVTFNNATSTAIPVTIRANAFGIFTISQTGMGPGVFTDPNFKVNTLVNAAHAGDQSFIWGTGLGAISGNDANAPPVGSLDVPVEVYVGGVKAAIGYLGRSGCCSGIDQILITIPAGVTGCYVPVVVKIGNIVSNTVTMSIAQSGSICSDASLGYSVTDLQKAQTNTALTVANIAVPR
jgi:uncharacterized protein (TIGR03437 family)